MGFTLSQFEKVNGYGNQFWGGQGEAQNMRIRLAKAGMWPPKRPSIPKKGLRFYFRQAIQPKPPEVPLLRLICRR